ncbi:cytochrome c3 family protein [Pyrobaculum ferrireducens]|uniref:Cytochrome c7-like domain-containing protein n=1 Tax=Pyrobaculum ferrireducens TaxID=1104324 RepID=G7VGI5_9CREN|nr:cytochrome c3 family protein [Pyrobaculum ferrireducens]AET33085.1 hypothetical protein P186_1671 [Pyrobaculum ferrireducens]
MKRSLSRVFILRIVVLALLAILLALPVFYAYFTYTPTLNVQCSICHTMKFYVANISKPHATYSCLVCHNLDMAKILNIMWTYVTQSPAPRTVFEKYYPHRDLLENCKKCHADSSRLAIHKVHDQVVKTLGTCSVCHAVHIQNFLDQSCVKCHPYLDTVDKHMQMHGGVVARLAADDCARCHSPLADAPVLPANICLEATIEGRSCMSCHAQLRPPDISDKPCIKCHYK